MIEANKKKKDKVGNDDLLDAINSEPKNVKLPPSASIGNFFRDAIEEVKQKEYAKSVHSNLFNQSTEEEN
jgi:hypothetical protein